ncbi:MAG: DUF4062 domain-containing protein [Defluviitaleaceae bacterium]|nr:DUF4062 domain-containing protein [Defluviitaleaceae bacterium]
MAIPKVMISSTCYDLKQIRENLEAFIRSLGYDPVRSDKGDIGYNITDTLKSDCFLAAQQCDILVGIIGGNFGSEASPDDSITMREMKTALEYKKQVYVFVDSSVLSEFRTYKINLTKKGERFAKEEMFYDSVNDTRIFDFINDMYAHESERVVIHEFQNSTDISDFLKKQWANLFQVYLDQKERDRQSGAYSKINDSATRLDALIQKFDNNLSNLSQGTTFLLENQGFGKYAGNPILGHLKKLLKTNITLLFKTPEQLIELMDLFGYSNVSNDEDGLYIFSETPSYGYKETTTQITFKNIFKEGKLIFPNPSAVMDDYIELNEYSNSMISSIDDDDLPF